MALNKKNLLINLILLFSSICLTLVSLEIVFRIVDIDPNNIYETRTNCGSRFIKSKSKLLGWEYKPNCTMYGHGYQLKLNSDGFIGKEYSQIMDNDTFRIIVLGDSFTTGMFLDWDAAYPSVMEEKLNEEYDDVNYEVLNFGVEGYNTVRELELLTSKAYKYQPDLVIVGFFLNDAVVTEEYTGNKKEIHDDVFALHRG